MSGDSAVASKTHKYFLSAISIALAQSICRLPSRTSSTQLHFVRLWIAWLLSRTCLHKSNILIDFLTQARPCLTSVETYFQMRVHHWRVERCVWDPISAIQTHKHISLLTN